MDDKKCKKCESANIVLVEYSMDHPNYYDGISEIMCMDCKARFGRWSGNELLENEYEPKFGIAKR